MLLQTRIFGEIELAEESIITFPKGIIGFPELKRFALIHDEENGANAFVHWLQSIEEPTFAMPVIDPLFVKKDYNPMIEDDLLKELGTLEENNTLILTTISIPKDIKKMSVNLQAPIIINAEDKKACQIIVDGKEYLVKYPIYDILAAIKKEGESSC